MIVGSSDGTRLNDSFCEVSRLFDLRPVVCTVVRNFEYGTAVRNVTYSYLKALAPDVEEILITATISREDLEDLTRSGVKVFVTGTSDFIRFPFDVSRCDSIAKADLIDMVDSLFPALDLCTYARHHLGRVLYTPHAIMSPIEKRTNIKYLIGYSQSGLQRRGIAKIIAGFIAISDYMRATIEKRYSPRRVYLIPNSVDSGFFVPSPGGGRPTSSLRLIYAGMLNYGKGVHELLSQMPRVLRKFPGARLTIVGDGDVTSQLIELSRSLGLEREVSFVQGATNEEMLHLYQSSDIFVSFSFAETFGLSAFEAMACGKPALVRSCAALGTVAQDENSGVVGFQTGDEFCGKLTEVLERYSELSVRARRFAERFTVASAANLRYKTYLEAIEGADIQSKIGASSPSGR